MARVDRWTRSLAITARELFVREGLAESFNTSKCLNVSVIFSIVESLIVKTHSDMSSSDKNVFVKLFLLEFVCVLSFIDVKV